MHAQTSATETPAEPFMVETLPLSGTDVIKLPVIPPAPAPFIAKFGSTLDAVTRDYILHCLAEQKGNLAATAETLGLKSLQLKHRLSHYRKQGAEFEIAEESKLDPRDKWNVVDPELGKSHAALLEEFYIAGMKVKDIAKHEAFANFTTQGAINQRITIQKLPTRFREARAKAVALWPKTTRARTASPPTARAPSRFRKLKPGQAMPPHAASSPASVTRSTPVFVQHTPRRSAFPVMPVGSAMRTPTHFSGGQSISSRPSLTEGMDMEAELAKLAEHKATNLKATLATLQGKVTQQLSVAEPAKRKQNDSEVEVIARQLRAQGFTCLAKDQESKGHGNQVYKADYYWHADGILADIARGPRLQPSLRMHVQLIKSSGEQPYVKPLSPAASGGRFIATCADIGGDRKVACVSYKAYTPEDGIRVLNTLLNNDILMLNKMAVPPRLNTSDGLVSFIGTSSIPKIGTKPLPDYLKECCFPKTSAIFKAQL